MSPKHCHWKHKFIQSHCRAIRRMPSGSHLLQIVCFHAFYVSPRSAVRLNDPPTDRPVRLLCCSIHFHFLWNTKASDVRTDKADTFNASSFEKCLLKSMKKNYPAIKSMKISEQIYYWYNHGLMYPSSCCWRCLCASVCVCVRTTCMYAWMCFCLFVRRICSKFSFDRLVDRSIDISKTF